MSIDLWQNNNKNELMKLFKFEMNTIVFLGIIIFTILAWVGFEFYHRTSDSEIDPALKEQAETPITNTFDILTLKEIYKNKSKFYEEATPTP